MIEGRSVRAQAIVSTAIVVLAAVAAAHTGTREARATLRVLFIGNSLTAANDLPRMVSAIAAAGKTAIDAEAVTANGFSLEDHWNGATARAMIAQARWDAVVLQQGPSALPESQVLLRDYARRFDAEIRKTGAKTALYMVWPSRTRFRDFDGVERSYRAAAEDVSGVLLPAGRAWRLAWRRDPGLPLYGADGFHPSALGSYLAALVVYSGLTGHDTADLPGISGVPELIPTRLTLMHAAAREAIATRARPE